MIDKNLKKRSVEYKIDTGETINLDFATVREYLVTGDETPTDKEIILFLGLCKYQKLNPFTKEAVIIKYSKNYPAALVVSNAVFLKKGVTHPLYNGHEVGISEDGKTAWCKVYKKGIEFPIYDEVYYDECASLKNDKPNAMWAKRPKHMLKKNALGVVFRQAFPGETQDMYMQEEIEIKEDENKKVKLKKKKNITDIANDDDLI